MRYGKYQTTGRPQIQDHRQQRLPPRREKDLQSQDHPGAGEHPQAGDLTVCGPRGGGTGTAVQDWVRRGREYDIRGVRRAVVGPAGPVRPQHVGELPEDAGAGISLHRRHPHQPSAAHRIGESAGGAAEADIPGQTHRGGHGAEVPDRGLRRSQRRQAERDHPEESGPDDRSADDTPHRSVHSLSSRDSEAAGCPGKGAAALPDVLSPLHVHRLPPG